METEQPLYYHLHVGTIIIYLSFPLCDQLGSINPSVLFMLANNLSLSLPLLTQHSLHSIIFISSCDLCSATLDHVVSQYLLVQCTLIILLYTRVDLYGMVAVVTAAHAHTRAHTHTQVDGNEQWVHALPRRCSTKHHL